MRIRRTHFGPDGLRAALEGARTAVLDLETTGLGRRDRIVAVGVLVGRDAHVLVTDEHRELTSVGRRVPLAALGRILAPVATRPDLTLVMHNAIFDVGMLERHGIPVAARVIDTMKLLKLLDPDRGREAQDGGTGAGLPRLERRYGEPLNYKLKDAVRHELDLRAIEFPGAAAEQPFDELVRYLKSDLICTRTLFRWVWQRLSAADRSYKRRLVAPLTPLLVRMATHGVQADPDFIRAEGERLLGLMRAMSAAHHEEFGQALDVGDAALQGWIYGRGLRCRRVRSGKTGRLSLRAEDIRALIREATADATRRSLELVHDYKLAQSLMVRLRALASHVDPATGRIHSTFNDVQASGRVSSTRPNLQQVAAEVGPKKRKKFVSAAFREEVVRSRNAIVAPAGHRLVAFDIAQADIRVLAHMVESVALGGRDYLRAAEAERRPNRRVRILERLKWHHFRPQNRKAVRCPACWMRLVPPGQVGTLPSRCATCGETIPRRPEPGDFDPSRPCELAEDFRRGGTDFYTVAAERMLGRPPRDKTERDHMKQTILGIVNGMGPPGLARRLGVSALAAADYLAAFERAYPQVAAYTRLMHQVFALTGLARTFAGRPRRITAHRWMATRNVVDLFVSYKWADKLWLRVVPLRANRHTLTCWVLRAIDVRRDSRNEDLEIYHHRAGRISQAPYRFFDDAGHVFGLPVRNVSWRLIRRVRTRRQEAVYKGFDKSRRQLFNHIAQGGTADIAKTMMLRAEPVCRQFGARLVIQIHDELVFEVPDDQTIPFARRMRETLEQPPTADFRVPIVVEAKAGLRFGELQEITPEELAAVAPEEGRRADQPTP